MIPSLSALPINSAAGSRIVSLSRDFISGRLFVNRDNLPKSRPPLLVLGTQHGRIEGKPLDHVEFGRTEVDAELIICNVRINKYNIRVHEDV
jgi:hypothetical protein